MRRSSELVALPPLPLSIADHLKKADPLLTCFARLFRWARRSPLEAHRIACAGREMARRVMTDDQLDAYAYAVMLELAELQRDDDGGQRD